MPRVQRMDRSAGHAVEVRWIAPPSLPVREPAQVLDRREDRPWPFLYSYRGDTVIINKAPTKTRYEAADEVGVALF